MSPLLKIQPNPFRFLLYTEWFMLASCGSLAVVEALEKHTLPVQHILILALIGSMGLMLPSGKPSVKVLYTAIEIGLIFYGTALGYLHILPTLYLIVVIRSCLLFDLPGRLASAGLSFILFSLHQLQYLQSIPLLMLPQVQQEQIWMHQLTELMMFALGLFLLLQLANTLLAERLTKQQLSIAHEQLQQYTLQVEDLAAVQERNRIAREIHDSLGHALTALNVQLQTGVKLWKVNPSLAQQFILQAQRLGENAITEVRKSVGTLRADASDQRSLEQGISSLVEDFRQGSGISISTSISIDVELSPLVVKAVYRIVQESLTNIYKYAQATVVTIQLVANNDSLSLSVEDNGVGFNLNKNRTGFGLQGMQERVAALKGYLYFDTKPGAGCRVSVEVPLQRLSRDRSSKPEAIANHTLSKVKVGLGYFVQ